MIVGVLGSQGSIGARHVENLRQLGHGVLGYDAKDAEPARRICAIQESDAIIIATPTHQHIEDLFDCDRLAHGKPVLVEKPVGHVLINQMASWPVWVGYNLRFHPCVRTAKTWMQYIGDPVWANFICAQRNDKPAYLRDGVILNWSHEIDLALHLLGRGTVRGELTRILENNDNIASFLLDQKGCNTFIHLDYITEPERRGFTIAGSKGIITADLVARTISLVSEDQTLKACGIDTWNDNYREELQSFLGDKERLCTIAEGLETLRICLDVRWRAGL